MAWISLSKVCVGQDEINQPILQMRPQWNDSKPQDRHAASMNVEKNVVNMAPYLCYRTNFKLVRSIKAISNQSCQLLDCKVL